MFKLTPLESDSALWKKISEELTTRLGVLRQKNDGDLSVDETARLRGEIKAIKTMLEWGKPTPTIIDSD